MSIQSHGLIRVPFGAQHETRRSHRYAWDNFQRGREPFVIVQHTRKGEGIFEIGGESHRVPPGHALIALVPEKSRYRFPVAGSPWIFSWVNFFGELALRLWTDLRAEAGPVIPLASVAARLLRQLARGTQRRGWTDPYQVSATAYRFYLEAVRHLPPSTGPRSPAREAALYFQAHYQKTVRMKEVAGRAGMSREHFTRLFRQEMGKPPAVYLRELRLEMASRLLRTTTMPVGEVALRSGWPSAAKLDLFFRRRQGVSPRDFRRKHSAS